ncbi:cobalt ABC transporter permease [Zavarzinia compransoris]|uniref:cobalt ABC transporter permease n=1 Tax=Zavarzinia marina TaxID=2911065 RepID=UPI001F20C3B1|nr:cobalt ABC transporter permease [Zavarzinia marina]MCF4167400.1 cobalt ABC transporter permease [Zavarzinia marina]
MLSLLLAFLVASAPAQAHKVIASVFPSGSAIEGEIGFSNGDMATNQLVEIFDGAGTRIGETHTDDDGFFTYTPTQAVTHVFKANMGAGHVAEVVMDAAEIAAIMGKAAPADAPPAAAAATVEGTALSEAIAAAVRDEIRPLRREIDAYKEKNDLQSVLGGMGYIAGLFGLGFFLAARRRLQA